MSLELAADAFDELSLNARHESTRAQRRILLLSLGAGLLTVLVIASTIDATRTSPARRFAEAVASEERLSAHCDDALGRRRFWIGPVVRSKELCVSHRNASDVITFPDAKLTFLVVGDWGRDGMCCQHDVALEMALTAEKMHPSFVVSVGDNFYNTGLLAWNDAQVDRSWRDVYIRPFKSMQQLQWKVILGNHDHQGNIKAQLVLSEKENLWHMPAKYFFETIEEEDVFMAFIDTTVLYYTQKQLLEYFRGDSVTMYYRDNQIAALKKKLSESKAKWKLVFGHHPLFSSGENAAIEQRNLNQIRTILQHIFRENNVAAYFSGHEHALEHSQSEGINYFISGGGSKTGLVMLNIEESVFAIHRQGYMAVSLRKNPEELHVQVVDMEGSVLHTASVKLPE